MKSRLATYLAVCLACLLWAETCYGWSLRRNRNPPPQSTVEMGEIIQIAGVVRNQSFYRLVGRGSGQSMAPHWDENTVLVITPIKFEDLEEGMLVAYRTDTGSQVVHELWRQRHGNWIAKGWGNRRLDNELVTPENIIGVVYAQFQAKNFKVPEQ